tara:strand:- start:15 stop:212 length:198 start_codon:yes stop_codon:yes gene_type:complete
MIDSKFGKLLKTKICNEYESINKFKMLIFDRKFFFIKLINFMSNILDTHDKSITKAININETLVS